MKTKIVDEILTEDADLRKYWKVRDMQILDDRSMVNLVKAPVKEGEKNWISNEPKTFFDTAKSLVSSYPPRFRMPLSINYDPEEKQKMSKTERFALAIYRQITDRQLSIGESYWLRDFAHWMLSGWYAVFAHAKNVGGEVYFMADLWDNITCYPWWDNEKLVRFNRSYEVDKTTAKAMVDSWKGTGLKFELESGTLDYETTRVVNHWQDDSRVVKGKIKYDIKNAILIGDTLVKPLTTHPQFERIPIFCGGVGSPDKTVPNWQIYKGEHIIAANRDMYDYANQILKLWVEILASTAYPNVVGQSPSGKPVIKEGELRGHGSQINLRTNEKLDLLKHAAMPTDAQNLFSLIGQWKQKGGLPDIVYGGVPFEMSGFAISQLMAAIKYKMAPYLSTMQYVMGQVITELMMQYKRGKFPKVTLTTTDPYSVKKDQKFFIEEYSKDDVPDRVFMDVTIPVTSALDKTQQIIFARQALTEPQLISRETIWDEVLEIQDSEQEYARILQDQMLNDPMIRQLGIMEQMRRKEEMFKAEGRIGEANALHNYIMMMEMKLGMRQGVPQGPNQGGSQGIPPEFSPPEAQQSPDVMRSALGVSSPGLSRAPKPESQGRKGMLVSPTGDLLI